MDFTTDEVAQQIIALGHSVQVIDTLIAGESRDEESLDTMNRNVRHIEIMCAMPHLSGYDPTPYTDAAARGNAWLAQD